MTTDTSPLFQEGNKIIAEFMGAKQTTLGDWILPDRDNAQLADFHFMYHSSWDWLMPVVEKINTIAIDNYGEMSVFIFPYICYIGENMNTAIVVITQAQHPTLIDMVWTAVVTFIKWYNNKKQ